MDVLRLLNSVGKKIFVEYYEVFSNPNLTNEEKVDRLPKHYAVSGSKTRVNCANRIFEAGLERDALKLVINSKADSEAIKKATIILNKLE